MLMNVRNGSCVHVYAFSIGFLHSTIRIDEDERHNESSDLRRHGRKLIDSNILLYSG